MQAPSYFLPRPPIDRNPDALAAYEQLYQATALDQFIDYQLPYPKWEFLTHISETKDVVFHGSSNTHIDVVEPQQAHDIREFSAQRAIYATTDSIWVIFFAILDRKKYPMSLFNSCLQARISPNQLSDPLYFFSITQSALICKPWCVGAVYILPRFYFKQEPPQQHQGMEIIFPHWIGNVPSKPIAKLLVGPDDFPFLDQIHGHYDQKLVERMKVDPDGFPWLDEPKK